MCVRVVILPVEPTLPERPSPHAGHGLFACKFWPNVTSSPFATLVARESEERSDVEFCNAWTAVYEPMATTEVAFVRFGSIAEL